MVPISEYRVKASPRINVANIVLKTSPDCCKICQPDPDSQRRRTTHCLKRRKHRKRKCSDLDCTSDDVCKDEHEHTQLAHISTVKDTLSCNCLPYLPSSPLVWRSSKFVGMFLVFKDMRLALESQSDRLEASRDQPDKDPDLKNNRIRHCVVTQITKEKRTATLPWGDRSPRLPITGYPHALVAVWGERRHKHRRTCIRRGGHRYMDVEMPYSGSVGRMQYCV
jgi:hypothetical protein